MNENKIMQQVGAIFSVFMVLFYVGIGIYFIFYFNQSTIDKSLKVILGFTFLFYGLYRGFRAYVKINEAFFRKDDGRNKYGQGNRI